MQHGHKIKSLLAVSLIALALFASAFAAMPASAKKTASKTSATIALEADPSTLDWTTTTDQLSTEIDWHIYEGLFAFDKNFNVRPMLAKSYTYDKGNRTYHINLRQGIKFSNGADLTADDVLASFSRWEKLSNLGKLSAVHIDSVTKAGTYAINIKMKDDFKSLLTNLASVKQPMVVLPKAIVDQAGTNLLTNKQAIGTGPYKFVSWKRGSELKLTKNNNYKSLPKSDNWGGLAGYKHVYVKNLDFKIITDPQSEVNGIVTGTYDYAEKIPADLYKTVKAAKGVKTIKNAVMYPAFTINHESKYFKNNSDLARAINFALKKDDMAKASEGSKAFYSVSNGSLFTPDNKSMYTKAGTSDYFVHDLKKAKALVKKSGYKGGKIILVAPSDKADMKTNAQVAQSQLKKVGINVKVVTYDWATVLTKENDPTAYDMISTAWTERYSPDELSQMSQKTGLSGFYQSTKFADLQKQYDMTSSKTERKKLLGQMNKEMYDSGAFIKLYDKHQLDVYSNKLHGINGFIAIKMWNVTKK
ncbi:MAG: ABC transporter substrate-binding protein [Oenococcus sp.]|uniref:ABC transporter substrate-binding protein n=1 Tax=Oenococcus sp. TaxID=1979414 RepID=UPI0039E8C06C